MYDNPNERYGTVLSQKKSVFCVLCEVVLPFKSGDKYLMSDHTLEISDEMQVTSSNGRHFAK